MGNEKRIRATVAIVTAYLEANPLPEWELPALIEAIGNSLLVVEKCTEQAAQISPRPAPVVVPGRSAALRHQRRSRFSGLMVTRH